MHDVRLPPISFWVQFFPGADHSNKPEAAIVTDFSTNGVLTLSSFPSNGGIVRRRSVRHMDDPSLKENMNHRKQGGWDYIPGIEPVPEADPLLYQKARRYMIEGFDVKEIAKKLHVSQPVVTSVLHKELAELKAQENAKKNEEPVAATA